MRLWALYLFPGAVTHLAHGKLRAVVWNEPLLASLRKEGVSSLISHSRSLSSLRWLCCHRGVCEGLSPSKQYHVVSHSDVQSLSGDKKERNTTRPIHLSLSEVVSSKTHGGAEQKAPSMLGLWALLPGGCGDTFSFLRISSVLDNSWKTEILLQLTECDWHIWKCVSTKPGTRGSEKNAALREKKKL